MGRVGDEYCVGAVLAIHALHLGSPTLVIVLVREEANEEIERVLQFSRPVKIRIASRLGRKCSFESKLSVACCIAFISVTSMTGVLVQVMTNQKPADLGSHSLGNIAVEEVRISEECAF